MPRHIKPIKTHLGHVFRKVVSCQKTQTQDMSHNWLQETRLAFSEMPVSVSGSIKGALGAFSPHLEALPPLAPPSEEKNGQNQPFSANFWIFAPSESHFAPSMPPTQKKFWCSHWPVFRFLPEFRFFVSPNLHVFIHFQPIFGCFGSNLRAFSGFSHQFQVFWVGLTDTPAFLRCVGWIHFSVRHVLHRDTTMCLNSRHVLRRYRIRCLTGEVEA